MKKIDYTVLSKSDAKKKLIKLLQNAHAGEKAAANAYYGHSISLFVTDKTEKKEIFDIYKDELHHRKRLKEMLTDLGAKPNVFKEFLMFTVGFIIGFLCLFGGWFIPMYGAGKLESENVEEYEVAARLAFKAGFNGFIEELLIFAEIEWDHEEYFRKKSELHWVYKYMPKWKKLDSRESIRELFKTFDTQQ